MHTKNKTLQNGRVLLKLWLYLYYGFFVGAAFLAGAAFFTGVVVAFSATTSF